MDKLTKTDPATLPVVLAGPILRRVQSDRLAIWLAVRAPYRVRIELLPRNQSPFLFECEPNGSEMWCLTAGQHLHYLLIDLRLPKDVPQECLIPYRISLFVQNEEYPSGLWQDHTQWAPDLCYPNHDLPFVRIPRNVSCVMHGSCRKPHSKSKDGLIAADHAVAQAIAGETDADVAFPELLVMSGDQVYVDDVAGPMVQAIAALVDRLGLPDETLSGVQHGLPQSGSALRTAGGFLYQRHRLLPALDQKASVFDVLFGGTRKPIFTSQHARNHLLTLGEMLAMYLLVWSPATWTLLPQPEKPQSLSDKDKSMYDAEQAALSDFVSALPKVRRLMAHVPTAMIFDDHDVTDDWNLSLAWEQTAYGHPLSRRVIGNALIAYGINQGWGNRPAMIRQELQHVFTRSLSAPGSEDHDRAIDDILDFENWDFSWPTQPPLIALDTRTRRWRSERNSHLPSGLLDWEAATDLQAQLRGQEAVLLVSAAPIFGVKLIESVQKLFTMLGMPLMVDAEYWMAHTGTASAILNVFQHRNTPKHFVILSGDVHYSFVYDVELRNNRTSRRGLQGENPEIWQICSSGIKNTWPDKLIALFDRLNRWAFSPRSPLNWLTKRRGMRIIPRKPLGTPRGRRILNTSGVGLVELNDAGAPVRIRQIAADGRSYIFERREAEARLD